MNIGLSYVKISQIMVPVFYFWGTDRQLTSIVIETAKLVLTQFNDFSR